MMPNNFSTERFLLCRAAGCWCALSLQGLGEVMRPQPLEKLGRLPEFVDGLSVIRGKPLPVVNLPRLLTGKNSRPSAQERFVTAISEGHRLALRVDEVGSIRELETSIWSNLPSLLEEVHQEHVAAVGSLQGGLLLLLRRSNLISEDDWESLQAEPA